MHKGYCKAAKNLDSKYHDTPDDWNGPVKSALLSFGPVASKYEGIVLGLGIGCFGKLPAGIKALVRSSCAVAWCPTWIATTKSFQGGSWACMAIFAFGGLILGRSRKLAGLQSPAACAMRTGGDSRRQFDTMQTTPLR